MIQVSAPGKLFLLGEYAVLDGAPALLSAVDRRVQVTVERATGPDWTISAPDIGIDNLALAADGGLPGDLDAATRARLGVYDAVRATVAEHVGLCPEPLAMRIGGAAFSADGHKLGLGASAAVAAALTGALTRASGADHDRATLCQKAIAAHRRAQHGAGSGADVATSIYGGVIEYQADTVQAALSWPEDITGMAVVTGTGASTTDLVGRIAAYAERAPARYAADMADLKHLAAQARAALASADAFLALAGDYFAALQTLDSHAQAGIVLDQHRELGTLATRHGGVFKTTGAGGGDLGLVFSRSGEPARRLASELINAGAHIVPLMFGARGLQYNR